MVIADSLIGVISLLRVEALTTPKTRSTVLLSVMMSVPVATSADSRGLLHGDVAYGSQDKAADGTVVLCRIHTADESLLSHA